MRTAIRFLLLTLVLVAARPATAATTIAVTAQGATAYLFDGATPNGPISLVRGQTYTFQVNATGHPFHITTAPGLPTLDFVDPGLTGNGTASGMITFVVPTGSSPAQLFFQCGVHTAMTGTINLTAPAAVAATGSLALIVLAAATLLAGLLVLRKRAHA